MIGPFDSAKTGRTPAARVTGTALMLLGASILELHPWGLLALLSGFFTLFGSRASREQRPAWPELGERQTGRSWMVSLGMVLLLLEGAYLGAMAASRFNQADPVKIVGPGNWIQLGLWVMLGLFMVLSAALVIRGRPLSGLEGRGGGGSGLWQALFWAACALIAAIAGAWPLGSVGLLALGLMAPPAPAGFKGPGRPLLYMAAVLLLGGLALHFLILDQIPQGMNWEERITVWMARSADKGYPLSFSVSTGAYTGLTLYHQILGLFYKILDAPDLIVARGMSVAGWLVTAGYGVLIAAALFSETAALGSAAYFALAFFGLQYGRMAYLYIWGPAVCAGALAHALLSLKSRRPAVHLAASGFWCAVSVYGWVAGMVAPGMAFAALAAGMGGAASRWKTWSWPVACGVAAFWVAAGPGLAAFYNFPHGMEGFLGGHSGSILSASADPAANLSRNLAAQLASIFVSGTSSGMHYLPGMPLVPPWIMAFFFAGLCSLALRPLSAGSLTMLAALGLAFIPSWISDPMGQNLGRLVVLLLPVGVLFGLGWSRFAGFLAGLPGRLRRLAWPLSLLALAGALAPEPYYYFQVYRNDPEAMSGNFASSTYVVNTARAMVAPGEDLFFSERLGGDGSFRLLMDDMAKMKRLRVGADLLDLALSGRQGTLICGPIQEDWVPWLNHCLGSVSVTAQPLANPWGLDNVKFNTYHRSFIKPDQLVSFLRWPADGRGGLKAMGPGRWEGVLWPKASGPYRLSLVRGEALLQGGIRIKAGSPVKLALAAAPWPISVTGCKARPELDLLPLFPGAGNDLHSPLYPEVDFHGLRRSVSHRGAPQGRVDWLGLDPQVSVRFHKGNWPYGAGQSDLEASWQGELRVPKAGRYFFSVANDMAGLTSLDLGGKRVFSSQAGKAEISEPLDLIPSRSYAIRIFAERIGRGNGLRLQWSTGDEAPQCVPWSWLRPAAIPAPSLLKGE